MGSEEAKLESELKKKLFHIFKDFMTRVTKLEELGAVGNRLLAGYQQALEFLRRPAINKTSKLIENIIEVNKTKRLQSYIEAGCIKNHDTVQNLNKLNTCLPGLHDHLSKAKSLLNELECLLGDVTDVMQTANECLAPLRDKDYSDEFNHLEITEKEEKSRPQAPEMADYATLMGIIYSMLKQDYLMQEKIVTSLNLTSSSGELESYCLMWSLRPFISDEVMHQAWRLIP